jgi:hypothetical protein
MKFLFYKYNGFVLICFLLTLREVFVPVINWITPSSTPPKYMDMQAATAASLLHESDMSAGIVLTPMFATQPGQLFMLEFSAHKNLSNRSINLDKAFGLVFSGRVDQRDTRPLLYQGRVMVASHVKLHETPWKKSHLILHGRTEAAKQLGTRDMESIEETDPSSLPSGAGDEKDLPVQKGKRFEQIGDDAAEKMLTAMIEGAELNKNIVIIVDLAPGVGNLTKAFMVIKQRFKGMHLQYFGVCASAMQQEWLHQSLLQKCAADFESGILTIPGAVGNDLIVVCVGVIPFKFAMPPCRVKVLKM